MPTIWGITQPSGGAHDCFADEIAIDFPSVDHVVERLRDRFLGERTDADTLTTEVLLSRREQARGTVVSLDLPLRTTCRLCGGRGEIWAEPCLACAGSGDCVVDHPLRVTVPPGVAQGARFRLRIKSAGGAPVRVEIRVTIAA